jgi:hypothetical protein
VIVSVQILHRLVEAAVLCTGVRAFVKLLVHFIQVPVKPLMGSTSRQEGEQESGQGQGNP